MRSLVVRNNAKLQLKLDNTVIRTQKKIHVQPSEMMSVKLRAKDLEGRTITRDSVMEVSLQ
jgi:cytochrome c oxidase assembly protein Cox11